MNNKENDNQGNPNEYIDYDLLQECVDSNLYRALAGKEAVNSPRARADSEALVMQMTGCKPAAMRNKK